MSRISLFAFIFVCFLAAICPLEVGAEAVEKIMVYKDKGRRDPFMPLITGATRVAAGLESVQTIDDIILEGIVWDASGDSIAIMNGIIVKNGDEIGVVKIDYINELNVELYINNIKHKIALSGEGEE